MKLKLIYIDRMSCTKIFSLKIIFVEKKNTMNVDLPKIKNNV